MVGEIDDTIAAIASAPGSSVRGIIRVSGPDTLIRVVSAFGLPAEALSGSTRARRPAAIQTRLKLEPDVEVDSQLLVWPDSRSYTRQPSIEIHTIGSPPVLQMMLERLLAVGCRLAEPGEFTLRAFLSGRLDLTQAEAVMDVIDARSQRQLQLAVNQLAGGFADPISDVREKLIEVLAELEAGLDFVEEDIEFISSDQVLAALQLAQQRLQRVHEQIRQRQVLRDRVTVVLVGQPNVGKSSLFNVLSGAHAIVSDVRGTTRDYIKADLDGAEIDIELIDTAGLESIPPDSEGPDSMGGLMAAQTDSQLQTADIRIVCVPGDQALSHGERQWLAANPETTIFVRTKCDLIESERHESAGIATSVISQAGIEQLKAAIVAVAERIQESDSGLASTLLRTADSFAAAIQSISHAIDAIEKGWGDEVVAAEVRTALDHLGRIVGTVYTDEILDIVFSRFCIGK